MRLSIFAMLLAVCWAGVGSLASGQAPIDKIFLVGKGGEPIKGAISGTKPTEVTVDQAGASKSIPANEVARIIYDGEPPTLANVRNAVIQKNYNLAKTELDKLDLNNISRDVVKQEAEYLKAFVAAKLAMTAGGDKKEAMTQMKAFARANRESYHFYDSAEVLGDLAVASGDFASAANYYGEKGLGAAPWPEVQMRAGIAGGRALVLAKKYEEGLAKFSAVLASEVASPEAKMQKQHATVGKAVCLAETGKTDEGIKLLNDIIATGDPADVKLFARVYNALGHCLLKTDKKDKEEAALMAYLHTSLLFFSDSDAHAESLYNLAKLWDFLEKKDRATDARRTLTDRYAGSIWANQ